MSHTPGPWRFRAPPTAGGGNPWVVLDKDSHVLAIVPRSPREANARLIAAAPDMLAFIKQIVPGSIYQHEIDALIAKAEGRES